MRWLALVLALAACGGPATWPRYEQTETSRAAFAFLDRVAAGEGGDLRAEARAAGLVEAGVCTPTGAALYCNALRVTKANYAGTAPPGTPVSAMFGYEYEEMRLCVRSRDAFGLVFGGFHTFIHPELARRYPGEMASLQRMKGAEPLPERYLDRPFRLKVERAVGGRSRSQTLLRMGYRLTSTRLDLERPDWFRASRPTSSARTVVYTFTYPRHETARRACRG